MQNALALARRETRALFNAPTAYAVVALYVALVGGFAFGIDDAFEAGVASPRGVFGWAHLFLVLLSPALTMRLFAEDRKTRAMDLLLTSPVTSFQVVLGKFLGAMGFAGVLAASTLHFPAILAWLGEPDRGILVANYVSFLLLLGAFFAVGMLASALTENQLVALVVAFGINLLLWVLGWSVSSSEAGLFKTVVESLSMVTHAQRLGKGLVHVQDIVYFLSFIGFCLFATTQRVEALRWR